MALEVEDGTGKANSESYCSVAFADSYQSDRGDTLWSTMSTAEKEAALRRATDYIEQDFRNKWQGQRVERLQALSWPRYGVVADRYNIDADIVPDEVQKACAELAKKAAAGDLNSDLAGQSVKKEKIGPIETEYSEYSSRATTYRSLNMRFRPFLKTGSASHNARLVRA